MIEQIEKFRSAYLEHLRSVVADCRNSAVTSAAELWLELGEGNLYKRFYRVDAISNDGEVRTFEANIDRPAGDSVVFEYRGVPVRLSPLVWNGVEIESAGGFAGLEGLDEWFRKWFDEEEVQEADRYGLSGVIHSMSVGDSVLHIDFGSAPAEGLRELLDLVVSRSPAAIRIHSDHYS